MVAVAWSFLFVLGGAMEVVVAVLGVLGVGIGVRLLQVLEGCDGQPCASEPVKGCRGVMKHDLYQRWRTA